jgi:SAM-dependent methyltransferase
LQPRPSQADTLASYDVDYYTHQTGGEEGSSHRFVDRLLVHFAWRLDRSVDLNADLVHRLALQKPSDICEIGCGSGALLAALQERGHRVVGLEPDPAARKVAIERGLKITDGNAEELAVPLAGQSFDLIVMAHVLEHCLDPVLALNNAKNLLRRGGLLMCETPNNAALGLAQASASWRWLDVPRHLNFFTASSLQRICTKVALKVKRIEFTGYTRQFQREWRDAEARIRAILNLARRGGPAWQSFLSWQLLVRTAFAARERKYDSVRVVAEASHG